MSTDIKLSTMRNSKDLSYQNYGNQRMTRDEYDRYKKSLTSSDRYERNTYTPAVTGERMRRMEGEQAGEIGSYSYMGDFEGEDGRLSVCLAELDTGISKEANAVLDFFMNNEAFGEEWINSTPGEIVRTINDFPFYGAPLKVLDDNIFDYCEKHNLPRSKVDEENVLQISDLQDARQEMNNNISKVSDILTKYLRNDARVQDVFMKFLSMLHIGVKYIDFLYQSVSRGAGSPGELGNIRETTTLLKRKVTAGGLSAEFTPSHYESYLQLYKTPGKAVKAYARYLELKKKQDNHEKMKDSEEKELAKLQRMEELAIDFDSSHQYMLEKEEYGQQDIDYAFALNEKERDNAAGSMVTNYESASDTYISLILENVFKGMKNRMLAAEADGGLPDARNAQTPEAVAAWLDDDMAGCIRKNPKQMEMIIRGIKRSIKPADGREPAKNDIKEKLIDFIRNEWFNKIFTLISENPKEGNASFLASITIEQIVNSDEYAFGKQINGFLNTVFNENDEDQDPAARRQQRRK